MQVLDAIQTQAIWITTNRLTYHNLIIVILKVSERILKILDLFKLNLEWNVNSTCCMLFPMLSDATNDSYSVSQTQTINFTQQTLRQRQAQPPNAQQAPQSQSQQQSQLGMQINMNAQNSGKNRKRGCTFSVCVCVLSGLTQILWPFFSLPILKSIYLNRWHKIQLTQAVIQSKICQPWVIQWEWIWIHMVLCFHRQQLWYVSLTVMWFNLDTSFFLIDSVLVDNISAFII